MANGTTHPPVLWAQRNDTVLLTISVNDLRNEKYSIEEKTLSFYGENSSTEQKYSFDIQFFKEITPQESKHIKTQRGLFFVLKKKDLGPYWPRLLEENKRVPFIKTDFNRWKDESDSEPEDDFSSNQDSNLQAMMQQMGGLGGQMGGLGGQMGGLGGQMGGLGGQMGGLGGQMGGLGGPMGGLGGPMGGLGGGPAGGGDLPGMDDISDDSDDEPVPVETEATPT